ncbi:protein-L-isoaspartate(D-aspartate) O-methyltransferase [Malassezia psittaci]|uniref:protein-L-isoaspartate(D-aspartate) O-methyltransferase n=1 Tax=Malassezia psittaci TaxID=1821823 RepID=A0AAF0FAQ5_9BASI|nr:protein-L-isoaspartate(D-aspartate) O-methyltransferase [Malassezia psittaci]
MAQADRANYILPQWRSRAYEDSPQPIGCNATISAPHMHAHVAEILLPYLDQGSSVLDVGSGSGYMLSIFHHLTDAESDRRGHVVGVEHIQELVDFSLENLRKDGLASELQSERIAVVAKDGRDGYPAMAPYSAIHVGAAAPTLPDALVDQLARPGRLIVPVENSSTGTQDLVQVDKDSQGKITKSILFGVMFVVFRPFIVFLLIHNMHEEYGASPAVQISASDESCKSTDTVVAHLMPFNIDYTGPAPINTYFLWDKADLQSDSPVGAVAAFRGRKVYGTNLDLPSGYKLGFFKLRELEKFHGQNIAPKRQITRPKMRTVKPPIPIRGSRFSMSDDDEELQEPGFATQAQDLDSTADSDFRTSSGTALLPNQFTPAEQDLHLIASAGQSLWIWNPDGPIDAGDDVYIRTCREWLSSVATAVSNIPLTQLHDFSL